MPLVLITITAALLLGPWGQLPPAGPATGAASAAPSTAEATREVRAALDEARVAAQRYGRLHLGHFRTLNHRKLATNGFVPRADVRLALYVTHTTYCVSAT